MTWTGTLNCSRATTRKRTTYEHGPTTTSEITRKPSGTDDWPTDRTAGLARPSGQIDDARPWRVIIRRRHNETVADQRRRRPPPTGRRFCGTAATASVQKAHRTLSSTKRAGKYQQPSNELGGCLRRKFSPSAVLDDTDQRQGKNGSPWAAQLSRPSTSARR